MRHRTRVGRFRARKDPRLRPGRSFQVNVSGATSWLSDVIDMKCYERIVWGADVRAANPSSSGCRSRFFLQTSDKRRRYWEEAPLGVAVLGMGSPTTGTAEPSGRYARVRAEIARGEAVVLALRCVARAR